MSELKPLWPNDVTIPCLSVAGEHGDGKSILGPLICPESFCGIDLEGSLQPYESAFSMKCAKTLDDIKNATTNLRIDFNAIAGLTASSSSKKKTFEAIIAAIPAGRWRVISVDALTDAERFLADYVGLHPEEFGYSQNQFARGPALKWDPVQQVETNYLLQLMGKAECVVACRHMGSEWKNSQPTGKRKIKGLDPIDKLATLSVLLSRKADSNGKRPRAPSATVVKHRLMRPLVKMDAEGNADFVPVPLAPARYPVFTPQTIRHYITNPPDLEKPAKGEREEKEELSADDKLLLQAQIAADTRATAEVAAIQAQETASLPPLPPPNLTGDVAKVQEKVQAKVQIKQSATSPMKTTNGSLSESTLAAISRLKKALEITDADWQGLLERFDAPMDQNTSRRSAVAMDPPDQERLATYLAAELESNGRQSKREEMAVFAAGN
jgi:hypothetical protein